MSVDRNSALKALDEQLKDIKESEKIAKKQDNKYVQSVGVELATALKEFNKGIKKEIEENRDPRSVLNAAVTPLKRQLNDVTEKEMEIGDKETKNKAEKYQTILNSYENNLKRPMNNTIFKEELGYANQIKKYLVHHEIVNRNAEELNVDRYNIVAKISAEEKEAAKKAKASREAEQKEIGDTVKISEKSDSSSTASISSSSTSSSSSSKTHGDEEERSEEFIFSTYKEDNASPPNELKTSSAQVLNQLVHGDLSKLQKNKPQLDSDKLVEKTEENKNELKKPQWTTNKPLKKVDADNAKDEPMIGQRGPRPKQ